MWEILRKVEIIGIGITLSKAIYLVKNYFELAYDTTKLALEVWKGKIIHHNLKSTP